MSRRSHATYERCQSCLVSVRWYEFDLWDVNVNIIKEIFPPQPPQEGKFGKLIVPYDIDTAHTSTAVTRER